jgi:hypothetical protein
MRQAWLGPYPARVPGGPANPLGAKIVQGAKPGDLPIEQASKFWLVVSREVRHIDRVVYVKRPFAGPKQVLGLFVTLHPHEPPTPAVTNLATMHYGFACSA